METTHIAPARTPEADCTDLTKEQQALFDEGWALRKDIFRFLKHQGYNHDDVQEAHTETFVRFAKNVRLNKFRGESSLKSYISSIALFTAADIHRRKQRQQKRLNISYVGDYIALAKEPEHQEQHFKDINFNEMPSEMQRDFWQAVENKLSPVQYKVLFMDIAKDMSGREIAHTLQISEGNARISKLRGLEALKKDPALVEQLMDICSF